MGSMIYYFIAKSADPDQRLGSTAFDLMCTVTKVLFRELLGIKGRVATGQEKVRTI